MLGAVVLLAAGACRDDEEAVPWSPGGYMPGTPIDSGSKADGGTVCAGNCGFLASVAYASPTPGGVTDLAAADVNGDGHDDLLAVGTQDDGVALLLNRGDGTFASHVLVPVLRPGALRVEDLDGDGKKDLAVTSGNFIHLLWGTCR